jgi:hypothetical protein
VTRRESIDPDLVHDSFCYSCIYTSIVLFITFACLQYEKCFIILCTQTVKKNTEDKDFPEKFIVKTKLIVFLLFNKCKHFSKNIIKFNYIVVII